MTVRKSNRIASEVAAELQKACPFLSTHVLALIKSIIVKVLLTPKPAPQQPA